MRTWSTIVTILHFNPLFETSLQNASNLWPDSSQPLLKLSSSFEGRGYILIRALYARTKWAFKYRRLQKYISETLFFLLSSFYPLVDFSPPFCYVAETSNKGLFFDVILESVEETVCFSRPLKEGRCTVMTTTWKTQNSVCKQCVIIVKHDKYKCLGDAWGVNQIQTWQIGMMTMLFVQVSYTKKH